MWLVYFLVPLSLVNAFFDSSFDSGSDSSELPILSSIHVVERNHVPMAEVALLVVRRYISTKTNTAVILKKCHLCTKSRYNFQSRLLEHFLKNFNGLMTLQLYIGRPNDHQWNYNIFIIDSIEAFTAVLFHFPSTWHERDFFFLIILTHTPSTTFERNIIMHRIFESCLRFNVLNVVIVVEHHDRGFLFYSYRLFGRKCDYQIDVKLVNLFSNGSLARDMLFPRQLINLSNCTLNVSAHILPPVLIFNGDPSNSTHLAEIHRLSGIDGQLLRILSNVMKFKIALVLPKKKSVIAKNGNSTGCFAMLQNGKADIAIGGFSVHQPHSYIFTPSAAYHQGPLVFIVRSIGHHFSPVSQLVQPFQPIVWYTILITLAVAIGVIRLASIRANREIERAFIMGYNNHSPITNLLITFLGYPIAKQPRRNFARFLLVSWMLVTFVLRNAYQAKMYDTLRVARRIPLPRNLDELKKANYTLLASSKVNYYPHNRTLILPISYIERYKLVEEWDRGKWVTTSMLDNLVHHNRLQWKQLHKSHLTYVKEPIFQYPLVMFFRKHSNLRSAFDKVIKYLMSAGFMSHIAKLQVKLEFRNMNSADLERVSQISSEKLQGLYVICAALMGCGVCTFLLELLSCKIDILRRFFLWVNCAD